jgi:hypothetical protein
MSVPSDPDPDCFALAKEAEIEADLRELERINLERKKQGFALLTYPEYDPKIHR